MAIDIVFTVDIVDSEEYRHIVAYGGSESSPFSVSDIYDKIKLSKPEWATKLSETVYAFKIPVKIGRAGYNSYINDNRCMMIVERDILSSGSYSNLIEIVNMKGTVDHATFKTSGNMKISCEYGSSNAFTVFDSIFIADRMVVYGNSESDILMMYDNDIDAILEMDHIGIDLIGNRYRKTIELKNGSSDRDRYDSTLKIYHDAEILSPRFDKMDIVFFGNDLTLDLVNISDIDEFVSISSSTGCVDNKLRVYSRSVINVENSEGEPEASVAVKITNSYDLTLFSGVTSVTGSCDADFIVHTIEIPLGGTYINEWPVDDVFILEASKSHISNFSSITGLRFIDIKIVLDLDVAYNTKFNGFMIDSDNKISTFNRLHMIRGSEWQIRARVYDQQGNPISLSDSSVVSISFYVNSYDASYFKTYSPFSINASGEVLFKISAVQTALFVYERYYYKIVVGGQTVVDDYVDLR